MNRYPTTILQGSRQPRRTAGNFFWMFNVLSSAAGHYIGTVDDDGCPFTRETTYGTQAEMGKVLPLFRALGTLLASLEEPAAATKDAEDFLNTIKKDHDIAEELGGCLFDIENWSCFLWPEHAHTWGIPVPKSGSNCEALEPYQLVRSTWDWYQQHPAYTSV